MILKEQLGNGFSPSITRVYRIQLRWLVPMASTFTHGTILLAYSPQFFEAGSLSLTLELVESDKLPSQHGLQAYCF